MNELDKKLFFSISSGTPDQVAACLNEGADVNTSAVWPINKGINIGDSPLIHACLCGKIDVMALLIKHQADVNQRDKSGNSALYHAIRGKREDMARLLMDNGADIHYINDHGYHLLIHAKNAYAVNYLASLGIDMNQVAGGGNRPLNSFLARYQFYYDGGQDSDTVRAFLERGAMVNHQNDQGLSPLMVFLDRCSRSVLTDGNIDNVIGVIDVLIEYGADLTLVGHHGNTIFSIVKKGMAPLATHQHFLGYLNAAYEQQLLRQRLLTAEAAPQPSSLVTM